MSRKINNPTRFLVMLLGVASLVAGASITLGQSETGETWAMEGYALEVKESFQFSVRYEEIPVRRWDLVVDGGGLNCDVSVLRVLGEELVYYETRESRHEISIPWGRDEEIMVVVTNRDHKGASQVSFVGPPRDDLQTSYSYDVNRALENFTAGKRLQALDNISRKSGHHLHFFNRELISVFDRIH